MDTGTLNNILRTECEIQARLEEERKKAGAWLKQERIKAEQDLAAEEERLRMAAEQAAAVRRAEADTRAAAMVEKAMRRAAGLRDLGDERLRTIARKHLLKILPGAPS